MAQLTARDKAILNCVFNPSLPLDEAYEEELDGSIIGKKKLIIERVIFTFTYHY